MQSQVLFPILQDRPALLGLFRDVSCVALPESEVHPWARKTARGIPVLSLLLTLWKVLTFIFISSDLSVQSEGFILQNLSDPEIFFFIWYSTAPWVPLCFSALLGSFPRSSLLKFSRPKWVCYRERVQLEG